MNRKGLASEVPDTVDIQGPTDDERRTGRNAETFEKNLLRLCKEFRDDIERMTEFRQL